MNLLTFTECYDNCCSVVWIRGFHHYGNIKVQCRYSRFIICWSFAFPGAMLCYCSGGWWCWVYLQAAQVCAIPRWQAGLVGLTLDTVLSTYFHLPCTTSKETFTKCFKLVKCIIFLTLIVMYHLYLNILAMSESNIINE